MRKKRSNSNSDPYAKREASKYDNPIASREYISELLEKSRGPLSHTSLCKKLELTQEDQIEGLRRRLIAMERDGQLIKNRKGAYGLVEKMDLIRGRVQGHRDGFGFVIPLEGEGDIYLSNRQMRKVFDGDEVLVRADGEGPNGKREGTIVEILSHNTQQTVGRYINERGILLVRPDNPRNCHDILIPPEDNAKAKDGQFVVVEIVQQPSRYQRPVGRIVEVLGDHMAPGMEIDVAIRSHGIPHVWPPEVEQQAATFTSEVSEPDKRGRIDLRKLPLVTIDGEDARDFDDAVFCEKKRSGGWRLYVAIADVSHYVQKDSALDKEAITRGTSVYFPDFVVPMLPQVLSNGLCSLNPKVDRLCMVCEMTISAKGKISGYTFYEAVMHSQARLTYTQVGQMIAEKGKKQSSIRQQYSDIVKHIDELHDLYQVLRTARDERGAIDFESKETKIVFDAERKIEKIVPIERNDAHKLIEECMLAANVSTAKLLESLKVPTLYRVHEGPRQEKLEMLHEYLAEIGLSMRGGEEISPQHYREVLERAQGRPDAHIIQTVMLRSMNQAVYQPANEGHFGLAYTAYAHFTSPIRRYPDLLVHRAIRALLQSDIKSSKLRRANKQSGKAFDNVYPYALSDMQNFGEQTSLCERRADEATRDVVSWLKCEYLQNHVGEEFEGVVSAVTGFGLFVELRDLYIEGLIHVATLPHDYYHFEAAKHRLVGERTRKVFHLGDPLRVRVMRVDLDERKTDFELVGSVRQRKQTRTAKPATTSGAVHSTRTIRKRKAQQIKTTAELDNDLEMSPSSHGSSSKRNAKQGQKAKTGAVAEIAETKTPAKEVVEVKTEPGKPKKVSKKKSAATVKSKSKSPGKAKAKTKTKTKPAAKKAKVKSKAKESKKGQEGKKGKEGKKDGEVNSAKKADQVKTTKKTKPAKAEKNAKKVKQVKPGKKKDLKAKKDKNSKKAKKKNSKNKGKK
ncbi:Ribonuclease R [Thalassocella blandensis]|nr:Ribonuclease R [Thalassocella blandensis]